MSYGINYEFSKKIPNFASLITSIAFNNSFGVENYNEWTEE